MSTSHFSSYWNLECRICLVLFEGNVGSWPEYNGSTLVRGWRRACRVLPCSLHTSAAPLQTTERSSHTRHNSQPSEPRRASFSPSRNYKENNQDWIFYIGQKWVLGQPLTYMARYAYHSMSGDTRSLDSFVLEPEQLLWTKLSLMGPKWSNFEWIWKSWLCSHLKGSITGALWGRNFLTFPHNREKQKNCLMSIFRSELRLILLICLSFLLSGWLSQSPQRSSMTSRKGRDMTLACEMTLTCDMTFSDWHCDTAWSCLSTNFLTMLFSQSTCRELLDISGPRLTCFVIL